MIFLPHVLLTPNLSAPLSDFKLVGLQGYTRNGGAIKSFAAQSNESDLV